CGPLIWSRCPGVEIRQQPEGSFDGDDPNIAETGRLGLHPELLGAMEERGTHRLRIRSIGEMGDDPGELLVVLYPLRTDAIEECRKPGDGHRQDDGAR